MIVEMLFETKVVCPTKRHRGIELAHDIIEYFRSVML